MNFEEEFPSLKNKTFESKIIKDTLPMIPDGWLEGSKYISYRDIERYCLDKQRLSERYIKKVFLKEAIARCIEKNKYCLREYKYAFDDLLRELESEE